MRFVIWTFPLAACATDPAAMPTGETGMLVAAFELTSAAFTAGEIIPLEFECGPPFRADGPGQNRTPPLSWTPGPPGTQSYVVVMRDRDFRPAGFEDGLIHWAIFDIPADVTSLPAGIPDGPTVSDPAGAQQGRVQGSEFFGYFGPCSPESVNTYRFTVYAMPVANLALGDGDSETRVAALAEAEALDRASLRGES